MIQTPSVFMESEVAKLLLSGNSRAYIRRDLSGNPLELIPLRHDATDTVLHCGEKFHITWPEKDDQLPLYHPIRTESNQQEYVILHDSEVFHVPGFGLDGIKGMSIVKVAKRSFSVGLNQEERQEKQLRRGFVGKLIFNAPRGTLTTPDEAREFLKDVKERHDSDREAEDVVLLRNGMTHEVINMSNKDAEFMSQKNFHRQDVALLFLLESILGDDASVSYNSLEQKNLAYLVNCLMRLLVKFEQEADKKLLTQTQFLSGEYNHKFGVGTLLRPDTKTTADTLAILIQNNVINPNEARDKLDMNPYDGGENYGNPNITPGPPQPASPDTSAAEAMIEHLLGVEQNRTKQLSANGQTEKLDKFFDKWEDTFGNNIEKLGGCRSIALDHCTTARQNPAYDIKLRTLHITSQLKVPA